MSYQNNNIDALKKLYVAMGGDAADVANLNITPEMISAIADIYQGGGGASLPAVTTDDNGKLLTVVEGEWDKADNVGGAVEITLSQESQTAFGTLLGQFITAALTNAGEYTISLAGGISEYEDIQTAAAQGKRVIVSTSMSSAEVINYSANHVAFHIVVPMYAVQEQQVSMLLDVSLMTNAVMIQGFAKILDID